MSANRHYRLAGRPVGAVKASDWELVEETIPQPDDGEFVVEVTYISLDPAMRRWMNAARSYVPPVEIGEAMRAVALGRVNASDHERFPEGHLVHGSFGVQEYAVSDGAGVHQIAPADSVSHPADLGVLGLTGMTAYFSLFDVGRVQAGDTVLVSGAAGTVGPAAGQIAKIKDARAVAIVGGPEKGRMLVEELGFDASVDEKAGDLLGQLRQYTPDHVGVCFDNVGGEILGQGLTRLAPRARVGLCGASSQYDNTGPVTGPSNYLALLVNRVSMAGSSCWTTPSAMTRRSDKLSHSLSEGRLTSVEDAVRGDITASPDTLLRLLTGQNTGKLVLELDRTSSS